jgi:superoxide dismutase, Cu-Zn family
MIGPILAALAMAGAPGAAPPPVTAPPQPQEEIPIIELRRADGTLAARAMFYPMNNNLEIRVQAVGLATGRYGVHIHAVGRCDGPSFETAGPHLNPGSRQHGLQNPQGHHLGDLPNLEVNAQRQGRLEFAIERGTMHGGATPIIDADGAALVVHAAPDDERTDPSGNSGARIACGVLR